MKLSKLLNYQNPEAIKLKIHKCDYAKIQNFAWQKIHHKKSQNTTTNWEKISATHITNKHLVSVIYEDLSKFEEQMTKKTNNKMRKSYEQIISKKRYKKDSNI